jgi:hypothetical protein
LWGGYIAFWWGFITIEIFKDKLWQSLGILVGILAVSALIIAAYNCAALLLKAMDERRELKRPCSHGVVSGSMGGCPECVSERERERRAVELHQRRSAELQRIRGEASKLREEEIQSLSKNLMSVADSYLQMTSQQFEDAIAELFRKLGYRVEQTPYSSDGGKDAVAWKDGKKIFIECKRYGANNRVARPDLQAFFGAMKDEDAAAGFYICTGGFTQGAIEFAKRNNIIPYGSDSLPELVSRAYPVQGDISNVRVMCLDCGQVMSLPFTHSLTTGVCTNGHKVTNDVTFDLVQSLRIGNEPLCKRCGVKMKVVRGAGGKPRFWGCSQYPKCRSIRSLR